MTGETGAQKFIFPRSDVHMDASSAKAQLPAGSTLRSRRAPSGPKLKDVSEAAGRPRLIEIVLLDGFNLFDLSAVIDTLKLSERIARRRCFEVRVVGQTGQAVQCSLGLQVPVEPLSYDWYGDRDHVFILVGDGSLGARASAWLPRYARAAKDITIVSASADAITASRPWLGTMPTWNLQSRSDQLETAKRSSHSLGMKATLMTTLALIDTLIGRALATKTADALTCERLISTDAVKWREMRQRLRYAPAPLARAVMSMLNASSCEVGIPEIVKRSEVSLRQLERLFREYVGLSPSRFHKLCRLYRAHEALTTTGARVVEIARGSGFASESHFNREFKKLFKIGPRAYRIREMSQLSVRGVAHGDAARI